MSLVRFLLLAVLCAGLALSATLLRAEEPYTPRIAAASDEGERALTGFRIPDGLRIRLVAAEPLLANPVAFCLDEQRRIYVAETFRQKNAVVDNRDYMFWLDDDLAAMTVADRLAYHEKHLREKLSEFTREHDRIRRLEDRDGNGVYETSTVFTDGYNTPIEGTGAGVLAHRGTVWYTNIPRLWALRDTNGDGQADQRTALHDGFGVRVAFRGHDLHGLRTGPDGRIYFSIGDRGFHVETPHRRLAYPDQGAVFRCDPDGSNLELIHRGLRNPQELAFDQWGQLFTGDNNSDSGDRARWVQVIEGGDSGWRMNFQYLPDRGPWNREKLWYPAWEGQAAFLLPPIANFADGPSGLTYDPGLGLPEQYRDHFFLCDFRGGAANSGIRSFALKPRGASFELVDAQEFAWKILATDADFSPDGTLFVSDWVNGWDGEGKGRLYTIENPAFSETEAARTARRLMAEGFSNRSIEELKSLLEHPSQLIRQEAQFALAELGPASVTLLATVARHRSDTHLPRLARLHALWALGQIARKEGLALTALAPVAECLADADSQVRRIAAQVLGDVAGRADGPIAPAAETLLPLLADEDPHVQCAAALAAGKLLGGRAVPELMSLLNASNDRDPGLRHAGSMGLYYASNSQRDVLRAPQLDETLLKPAMSHPSPAVRLGALLALRKHERGEVARFLEDTEARLVEEAARAIYDEFLVDAFPALAELAARPALTEPTLWRVIGANHRLGTPEAASRIATIVANRHVPDAIRIEGLRALGDWAAPSGRDRVLGAWRPVPPRSRQPAADALRQIIGTLFDESEALRQAVVDVAGRLELKELSPALVGVVQDAGQAPRSRIQALRALALLKDAHVSAMIDIALDSESPHLRAAGRTLLAAFQPEAAFQSLCEALETGDLVEKQLAFVSLGNLQHSQTAGVLTDWMRRLLDERLPPELELDLLEAVGKQKDEALRGLITDWASRRVRSDPVSEYHESLSGGDAELGRKLFFEKASLSCVRCHKIGNQGGEVGPDLSSIATQHKRDYLLTALVDPNRHIARGFETVNVATVDGLVHSGIVKADDGETLTLITAEARRITLRKADIDQQTRGKSAMPEDLVTKMSRRELRDLVEFLSLQRAPQPAP